MAASVVCLTTADGDKVTELAGEIALSHMLDLCVDQLGLSIEYEASTLQHRVTVRQADSLAPDELWPLANRLLAGHDLTTIRLPGSEVFSVVAIAEAAKLARIEPTVWHPGSEAVGWGVDDHPAGFIKVVMPLAHSSSADLTKLLTPLLTRPGGEISGLGSDTLLIADLTPRVEEIARLLAQLDGERPAPSIERIPVSYLPADRLAAEVTAAGANLGAMSGRELEGKVRPAQDGSSVVLTAPRDEVTVWRELIETFDVEQKLLRRTYVPGAAYTLEEVTALIEQTARESGPQGAGDRWSVVANALAGTIIVTATAAEQDRVEALLSELDQSPAEIRMRMQSFPLVHRRVQEVQPVLRRPHGCRDYLDRIRCC